MAYNLKYGILHIKDPLPLFEKSRIVIPVANFSPCTSRLGVSDGPFEKWPKGVKH